jgi:hypothetical protein
MKKLRLPRDKGTVRWPIERLEWDGPVYLTFSEMEALLRDEPVAGLDAAAEAVLRADKPTLRAMLQTLRRIVSPMTQAILQGKVESN